MLFQRMSGLCAAGVRSPVVAPRSRAPWDVGMSTPEYYRNEAERCRALGAKTINVDMKDRWLEMALAYDKLADSIENAPGMTRPAVRLPMQQEVQQQQGRLSPPKDG